jgi:hypothetical protein
MEEQVTSIFMVEEKAKQDISIKQLAIYLFNFSVPINIL